MKVAEIAIGCAILGAITISLELWAVYCYTGWLPWN